MQRFLIYVSYIGTQFRGVQKIVNKNEPYRADPTTIQGTLEIALSKLKPENAIHVVPSSRTDTGVHALNSTFHVDLLKSRGRTYNTQVITEVVNKFFYKQNFDIRVLKTVDVPADFHCRYHAISRTYLYRLAVLKNEYLEHNLNVHSHHIPIEEYRRCHFICFPNFDMNQVKEISQLFLGSHDFRTFMGKGSHHKNKMTRRNMKRLVIDRGTSSACLELNRHLAPQKIKYDYWDIIFTSEGFLYNQVRRIVGTLIAAGQGKVSRAEVLFMLRVPSHLSWNPRVTPAPSHGLYLCEVEYPPHAVAQSLHDHCAHL